MDVDMRHCLLYGMKTLTHSITIGYLTTDQVVVHMTGHILAKPARLAPSQHVL